MFEVQAVAPGVFRVGMFGDGRPADYSSPAIVGGSPVEAAGHDDRIETPFGVARWADGLIEFVDPDGNVVAADAERMCFTGEPDPFAAPGRAGRGAAHGAAPETADGHRVFRIRTLAAFCDEVDRVARCIQDGDLARAIHGDTSAPTRLRLAARQLRFTLERVEAMLAG
jgi:hypothetical protein